MSFNSPDLSAPDGATTLPVARVKRRRVLRGACVTVLVLAATACATAGSYDDFFRSIKRDDASSVAELISRGFDPNTTDSHGQTGLMMALREPSPKVVKVLIAAPATKVELRDAADESPLMIAAIKGDVESVNALIARDADVNKTGWAPLHYAVSVQGPHQTEIARILLDHSAYIDADSPNKTTPLMMASYYGSPEAARMLLEEGADPTLRNQQGMSAADFARKGNRTELAAELDKAAARGRSSGRGATPAVKW
jgi:ankyrin repeat protein